jgi:Fe-S oxidoreductase
MPVLNAGYKKDYEELREKNKKIFAEHGISKIITNCPSCNQMFRDYKIQSEHVIETIYARKNKLAAKHSGEITYHDPCHLGRGCGIFEQPREILSQVGFTVKELPLSREKSFCCGGGAGVKTNYPELANGIAKNVLSEVKTKKLVTPCPLCYMNFKENAEGIEVLEFSEVLV